MNTNQVTYNSKYRPIIKILRKEASPYYENDKLALEVIDGKWGNNPERKEKLEREGKDYDKIQEIVNAMVKNENDVVKYGFVPIMDESDINSALQSMQFTLSKDDISGSFSLTFFPDADRIPIFNVLKVMDIVQIFEPKKNGLQLVFTGVIRRKNYVTQMGDSGGVRRLSVSGTAITGLVSQFYVNLDTSAMAITKQIASNKSLEHDLTLELSRKKNVSVKEVVKEIWKYFIKVSSQNGTPAIAEYLYSLIGDTDKLFSFDETTFFYPVGAIFKGQQTQDFFSLVDGVLPSPIYEKFAYTDTESRTMRIKMRKVPFSAKDWAAQAKEAVVLEDKFVKSVNFEQSDNEVYTVFYAYLNNSPIDEQKSLVLSTMENKVDNVLVHSKEYRIYGYRPLIAHFIGYAPQAGETDTTSQTKMQEVSKELEKWYGKLHKMLSGSITTAMSYENDKLIMPGEVVKYLDREFYVEGISHSWTYGSGGDINISVSRGGKYLNGEFLEDRWATFKGGA